MKDAWKYGSAQAGLGIILLVLTLAICGLQTLAILAVQQITGFTADRIGLFPLIGLWGQPDPSVVTGMPGTGALHWAIVAGTACALIALVVGGAVHLVKQSRDPQNRAGLASVSDVKADMSASVLVREHAKRLRPSLEQPRPEDVGMRLGEFRGVELWTKMEDPTILIGPSRSGKGLYMVINAILDAPGPVITSSNKLDNLALTYAARAAKGPCYVFAPGVPGAEHAGAPLHWNPVEGCVDEKVLVRRVRALIAESAFSGSTSNGGHWDSLGRQLASHLFHAAACGEQTVDRIWRWVSSPMSAVEAVDMIRNHPKGLIDHAEALKAILEQPPEQRSTSWGVLPTVLGFLESEAVRWWLRPQEGESSVDLTDVIVNNGTIYFVGDKAASAGYERVIDGLLSELDYVTKGIADAMPGSRLDPPVSYVLDELANFEYQGLPELISAGGGRGRVALAVFQSRSQMSKWGRDEENAMWDAAVCKIVLPGSASKEELAALSELIGTEWVERQSYSSTGTNWNSQVTTSKERQSVIEPSEIRTLRQGYGLVFYRGLKPIIPKFRKFTEREDADTLKAGSEAIAERLRENSEFAAVARGNA